MTAPQKEPAGSKREALIDLIEEHLTAVYHCTRVWSAWQFGTMTEDDFTDARGTELAPDLADAILDRLRASQPSGAAGGVLVSGSTVYVLNDARRPSNRWTANVQPGFDDDDKRISDAECNAIAQQIAASLASPSSGGWMPPDPLQGAADWLVAAVVDCGVSDLQRNLLIGYNRAKRLFDAAPKSSGESHE